MKTPQKTVYSEATQRTFERALELLGKKSDAGNVAALRALLADGQLHDVDAFVFALCGESK